MGGGTLVVVGAPAGRILEHLPGGVDRDHPLGVLGAAGHVRVELLGEPTVGRLDDVEIRLGIDLQELVQVGLVAHRHASRVRAVGVTDRQTSRMVEAVQRWRIAFRRGSPALDLGPSEIARAWEAGLAASGIPVLLSAAATPRPRLTFGAPLPAGRAAEHDLADLVLSERLRLPHLRPTLVAALPVGFELVDLYDVWLGAPSITAALGATSYRAVVGGAAAVDLAGAAERILAAPRLDRIRAKADRGVPYDLRPLILDLAVPGAGASDVPDGTSGATLRMVLRTSADGPSGRPDEVLLALGEILGCQLEQLDLVRERQWTSDEVPRL